MTNSCRSGCVRGCSSVVERSLRMREARGSTPRISTFFFFLFLFWFIWFLNFYFRFVFSSRYLYQSPTLLRYKNFKRTFRFFMLYFRSAQSAERIILQSLVCTCPSRSIGVLVNCNLFQSWRNIF